MLPAQEMTLQMNLSYFFPVFLAISVVHGDSTYKNASGKNMENFPDGRKLKKNRPVDDIRSTIVIICQIS